MENLISRGKIRSAQKVVIYGPEGIGKSTFASHFPNPLFCDTEGSTKELDVRRFDRPESAQMIYEYIDYVRAHPSECCTFVLDTADWAEKLLSKQICAQRKKDGIEEFGYGKGYTYLAEEFGRLLNRLEDLISLGIHVVVTAHAQLQKFEQPDENGSYDRWSLKLTKLDSPMLKEWADAVLFVNYKTYVEKGNNNKYKAIGGKRVMYTSHHPCWDAKNRWDLPEECEFDYREISPHIFNDSVQPTDRQTDAHDASKVDEILDTDPSGGYIPPTDQAEDLSDIPKALADLMRTNGVTKEDIRLTVAREGYYTYDTQIRDYDPDFIEGCLIGAWDQLYFKIMCNKDLPFGMDE